MKKIQFYVSILLVAAALSSETFAQQDFSKVGRTAFQFLKIGIGARQVGMGEAATASVRDANALFWNPAGITGIASNEGSFSYARWFADMNYISGAVGLRWQGVGVFGLSYAQLQYGNIPEALVPVVGGSADSRTGGTFTGHDLLVGLSYAREFTDQLSIGISTKFLEEKLFVYNVSLFAFDVGTNYDVGYKGLRLAMSAQNFGPSAKWLSLSNREEGYDIPLTFRIGLAADIVNAGQQGFLDLGESNRLMMSIDAVHSNDFGDRFDLGAEYWLSNFVAARGGYRFNTEEGNWSFGFGLVPKVSGLNLRFDYAFVGYKYLNSPHRITLALGF